MLLLTALMALMSVGDVSHSWRVQIGRASFAAGSP
jgi:hypothetical protein